MTRPNWRLTHRARRLEAGVCVNCGGERGEGSTALTCRKCLDRACGYQQADRARRRAAGKCWRCNASAEPGKQGCRPHLDQANARSRAYQARKRATP